MNTHMNELTMDKLEQVNGGLIDELKKVLTDIGIEVKQSFCSHSYVKTGTTRMRPFCIHDVVQYEVICTKCSHRKWMED